MLSKKSWSYLQILQDTNTHTLGLKSVMSKQCLCLAVKPQVLVEIPGEGFCLYLLLSPHNVGLLEEEEPRHTIHTGVFLWSVPLFTEEMEKSLLVVILLLFKVLMITDAHTLHVLCSWLPPEPSGSFLPNTPVQG